jgi:hypothetical protein
MARFGSPGLFSRHPILRRGHLVINLPRFDEANHHRAPKRENADEVKDPMVPEPLAHCTRQEGRGKITRVVEPLVLSADDQHEVGKSRRSGMPAPHTPVSGFRTTFDASRASILA